MHSVWKILFVLPPPRSRAQSNLVALSLNKIQFADQFPEIDACMQIQDAIATLPANGGEVEAKAFSDFLPVRLTLSVMPTGTPRNVHAIGSRGGGSLRRWSLSAG